MQIVSKGDVKAYLLGDIRKKSRQLPSTEFIQKVEKMKENNYISRLQHEKIDKVLFLMLQ